MNERIEADRITWEQVAAVVCVGGAVLSLATGFVFTTGWLLNAQLHPLLHGVGIVLLIVGIPLLILGGHFMDLRDTKVRSSRSRRA